MISRDMWKQVREMFYHEKESMRSISDKLGLSRNTVSRYINSDEEPKYNRKKERESKVNDYKGLIKELLGKKLIGTVIYERLKEAGYTGSLITLYRYLRKSGWKEEKDNTTRFETNAGEQMQYDWNEWNIKIGEKDYLVYIHCLILSYSRMKYYTVSFDKSSESILRAILGGMEYFQGYCSDILIDNAKSMILNHNRKLRGVEYSDDFLLFTVKYNIRPVACLPYRPRTKGKVERPFYYLEEHLLKDLDVKSIEELEMKLKEFTERVNSNFHRTLNRSPREAFIDERPSLMPFKNVNLSGIFIKEMRKVSNDGFISYKTNYYAIPMKYCNKKVFIENVMGKTLNIYGENLELVKSYPMEIAKKNYRMVHQEHIVINDKIAEKRTRIHSDTIKTFIEIFGEDGKKFVEGLYGKVGVNTYYHLLTVLEYMEIYGIENVLEAIRICIEINSYHKNSVKTFLKQAVPETPYIPPKLIDVPGQRIRCNLAQYKVLQEV